MNRGQHGHWHARRHDPPDRSNRRVAHRLSAASTIAGKGIRKALVVGLAALAALWRYKVGIIPVILACGAAGLVLRLVGAD